jgi:hypothetical protein
MPGLDPIESGHPPERHALASGWIAGSSLVKPGNDKGIKRMRHCSSAEDDLAAALRNRESEEVAFPGERR